MCNDSLKESLVGYLYSELGPEERRAFEAHLKTCGACRTEIAALRGVRDDLLAWAPPECRELPSSWADAPALSPAPMARLRGWMPAFGLAAAAMLVLAVSAAIANVEIRYDANGFMVRAGRTASAPAAAVPAETEGLSSTALQTVTAADLSALEQRVLQSFSSASARPTLHAASITSDNPQLSRDVRRLIEEGERRTRQEMAERFLEIVRDFEGHRRTDMLRVSQAINQLQSRTGAELAQTREAMRVMMASQNQTPQR